MTELKTGSRRGGRAGLFLALAMALVGLGAGGVVAVRLMRTAPPPRLEVVGPAKVEADHPDRSRPFEHKFVLKNPSDRPIRIVRVSTNCTCTSVAPTAKEVAPGGTSEVAVLVNRFDPYKDRFDEAASIETDVGPLTVRVVGRLPPSGKVHVDPQAVYLSAADGGGREPGAHTVRLRVPKACAGRITESDCEVRGYPGAALHLDGPRPDGAYEEYSVRLTVPRPGGADGGQGALRVKTGCESLTVPIIAVAVGH